MSDEVKWEDLGEEAREELSSGLGEDEVADEIREGADE